VTELGLTDVASFDGPTDDPASAYAACHVVALSSISEAFPYTVVEAMLASRAVVATAVGGVTEALEGTTCRGVALVVEPGDPKAMAGALIAVLGAPPAERHRVGADLRDRALTSFTARRVLDGYDAIYRELAGPSVPSVPAPVPDAATWLDDGHGPTDPTVTAGAVTAMS